MTIDRSPETSFVSSARRGGIEDARCSVQQEALEEPHPRGQQISVTDRSQVVMVGVGKLQVPYVPVVGLQDRQELLRLADGDARILAGMDDQDRLLQV